MMPISRVGVKRFRGFSLLEALIVTVLLGLLTVLVSPSLGSVYRGVVLKSTVRSIAGTLRYVRASAISASDPQVFFINFENHEFTIASHALETASSRAADHRTSQNAKSKPSEDITRDIPKYIHIVAADEAQSAGVVNQQSLAIKFFPNGGSTGGRLMFAHPPNRYVIDINPFTGKVSVDNPTDINKKTTTLYLEK